MSDGPRLSAFPSPSRKRPRPAQKAIPVCETCLQPADVAHLISSSPQSAGICDRCGGLASHRLSIQVRLPRPAVIGARPTSSVALDRIRWGGWDVNGYYRLLGVHTLATRAELRDAYAMKMWNLGPDDDEERITYAFKRLLDSGWRAQYDALLPGQFFVDPWIAEAQWASFLDERLARGDATTPDELSALAEMVVDHAEVDRHEMDEAATTNYGGVHVTRWEHWEWQASALDHPELLRRWQTAIIEACSEERVATRFVVGVSALGTGWALMEGLVPDGPTFFITVTPHGYGEQDLRSLAKQAVSSWTGDPVPTT